MSIYFDGCSKGNPGPAGCGWVVQGPERTREGSKKLGHMTNNEAEYHGLVQALKVAKEDNIKDIIVHGDSKLVIEHMNGTWKVKATNLKQLYNEAKELSSSFASITFKWIPRTLNIRADELANRSLGFK